MIIHPDYAIEQVAVGRAAEVKLQKGVAVRGRVVNAAGPVAHAMVSINNYPLAESADDVSRSLAAVMLEVHLGSVAPPAGATTVREFASRLL